NARIFFDDSAYYIHNTSSGNTISPGVMFPNATPGQKAIFRVNQNYNFPGNATNPNLDIRINGVLEVVSGKTLTVDGNAKRFVRNGILANGQLRVVGSAEVWIDGDAVLGGSGSIELESANAALGVAAGSYTSLISPIRINKSTGMPFRINGTLDGSTYEMSGSADFILNNGALLITAHPDGVNGTIQTSGNKTYENNAAYFF